MPSYEQCPQNNGPMAADAQAIAALLKEAFPPEERPVDEELMAGILEGRDAFLLRKDDTGQLEGVIAYFHLDSFAFVDYFATAVAVRGQGIGGEMLDFFIEQMPGRIILEVELPDNDLAQRRVKFYERHDFVLNNYDYAQPPLQEGSAAIPMRLMSHQTPLNKTEFTYARDAIYKEVYGLEA